ncbi:MAG: ribulose-phosphate 3-epimerase [Desulfovibrio sp.]|jgi:ribulose-phosphate 3-epimerase|nr:ribulose-phosphate 3-epimerase [Desulfovibrio sp.]
MILAPSILSADFGNLERELHALEEAGLTWVHFDVMDGCFVPNITFGPPVIKRLRKSSGLFFDVHLMIAAPERFLEAFAEAGADMLVVHVEAAGHLDRTLREIKSMGMKAGAALNPSTPVYALENVIPLLDLALIMSVNPGFGGQSFIPGSLGKVRALRAMLREPGGQALIEVDGGVDPENTPDLINAGAEVLVSGSAFFNRPPYGRRLQDFMKAASAPRPDAQRYPGGFQN